MSFTEALGMGEFRPQTNVDFGRVVEVRPTQGLFVAFEGCDGVGKTTQITRAASWVRQQGWDVIETREPGGTDLGVALRQLLLDAGDVSARAEALLFAADRAQHVHKLIIPAINDGKVVITDRYLASSIAYQGHGRELGAREIRDLSMWATGGLVPNLTVLLDLDPEAAAARQAADTSLGSPDRMERAGLDFQKRVREDFLRMSEGQDTWLVVDASLPVEEIATQVRLRLAQMLPVIKSW
ncbi:dTMP kinase [uncultured Mobiluncus sp.]|uniref:dTMP kinase n=1 Tax=uncultured Mobiluncus sp. TaxID=293425 RepID=UPI0025E4BE2F|nr:dTMP kinase [uncultured Mobiluncus sp.]